MMWVPAQVNHAPRGQHRPWEALGSTPQHSMHVTTARFHGVLAGRLWALQRSQKRRTGRGQAR